MYKIMIHIDTHTNDTWFYYQEEGKDYVANSLEEIRETALTLIDVYGEDYIKIVKQETGDDMDAVETFLYDSTDNYEELVNRPFINEVEVLGKLSLTDLGVQPVGDYATAFDLRQTDEKVNLTDAKVEATNIHVSEVEATFNNYYTKEEVDTNLANIDLTEYYTKGEIDSIVNSITNELDGLNAELETIVYGGE